MLASCTILLASMHGGWALKRQKTTKPQQAAAAPNCLAGRRAQRPLSDNHKTSAACLTQPSATHSVQPKAASQASTPARLVQRSGGARPRARKEGVVE
jgi:hypothetical protein